MTGQLLLNGKNILDQSLFELSLQAGTVLQDADAQFVGMTVAEDIAFALENDTQPVNNIKQKLQSGRNVLVWGTPEFGTTRFIRWAKATHCNGWCVN